MIPAEDHIYTADNPAPIALPAAFIVTKVSESLAFTLNWCLLTKSIVNVKFSRGVFLCASAMASSAGILFIDAIGGHVYEDGVGKRNPLFVVAGTESLLILTMIVLALMRDLHV